MRAFDLPPALEPLRAVYPPVDEILAAAEGGNRVSRFAIVQLWLTEGIPLAFKAQPGLYESLRLWLARRLSVHAKEITLVGSGRQGFCLSPGRDLGRPFGEHSDLDLTVVSKSLYERLHAAFDRWNRDYAAGTVAPRHPREKQFWDSHRDSVPSGLVRGFIDPHKIPNWDRYPEAQAIAQAMYEAHEKLKVTHNAPVVRKLSIRVYRDWDSFVRQMAINLEAAANLRADTRGHSFDP